jgi:hypothetical protein
MQKKSVMKRPMLTMLLDHGTVALERGRRHKAGQLLIGQYWNNGWPKSLLVLLIKTRHDRRFGVVTA